MHSPGPQHPGRYAKSWRCLAVIWRCGRMTTEPLAHKRLCMFAVTGGMCDCDALNGPVDLAEIRVGDLVRIRYGRLVSEDWLTVGSVGGCMAADGWLLPRPGYPYDAVEVTAHRKVGR